jgi:hypothetical protein
MSPLTARDRGSNVTLLAFGERKGIMEFPMILCLALALAGMAWAGQSIPYLTELTGPYETCWVPPETAPYIRLTSFVLPPEVAHIEEMHLVLSGVMCPGMIECNLTGDPDSIVDAQRLIAGLWSPAVDPWDWSFATVQPPAGPFAELSGLFHIDFDLDLLLGNEILVELTIDSALWVWCRGLIDSYATLTEVRLEIECPLPAERGTWGAVKAMYRE